MTRREIELSKHILALSDALGRLLNIFRHPDFPPVSGGAIPYWQDAIRQAKKAMTDLSTL